MQIKVKKPTIRHFSWPGGFPHIGSINFLQIFYIFESRRIKVKKLILLVGCLFVISLGMYVLTTFIRTEDLGILEIFKQVSFINITLWIAFLFFTLGINILIALLVRVKKGSLNIHDFVTSQMFIGVTMFFFMRFMATILILMDELLPFEINLDLRVFQFNLLTILFASQVWMIIIIYNNLRINLKNSLSTYPLFETFLCVIYLASLWSLTSP